VREGVDEVSEKRVSVPQAFFVESDIATVLHVKNRIHLFAKREDALKHFEKFKGNWVGNPFRM
jgi:hypothetical protein